MGQEGQGLTGTELGKECKEAQERLLQVQQTEEVNPRRYIPIARNTSRLGTINKEKVEVLKSILPSIFSGEYCSHTPQADGSNGGN